MPNLTVNVIEVKSLGCVTTPKRGRRVRDPMVAIRAGSQRRSTKVQFNAGPDAAFNQELSFYGIAAATTMWVQCFDGANPTSDALVGEMRASLADLLTYHTSKGIWLDLTECLASSRVVGRVLVVLVTDLTSTAADSSKETVSSSMLAPPMTVGGKRPSSGPSRPTVSPSPAMSSASRPHPSASPARPASRPGSSVSRARPLSATGGSVSARPHSALSGQPRSPSKLSTSISRPDTVTVAPTGASGRRASSTPRPASNIKPSTGIHSEDHIHHPPTSSETITSVSSNLLSSGATPTDSSSSSCPSATSDIHSDRLSSLSRAKHLPSPLDDLDAVTLPSAATSTSVVADTTDTTLTYSLSSGNSGTSHLLSSTTSPPPSISPRRHSLAHFNYSASSPSSPRFSPMAIPAVPTLPAMYAHFTSGGPSSSPTMGSLAMPEPTPFAYPGSSGASPGPSPRPFDMPPAGGSPRMFPSPTAYAQAPHVPSPYMAPATAVAHVSPRSTGASGGGSPSLAYPSGLFRPGGEYVTLPTDLGGHVTMPVAGADVPVYRGPVHYHPATPSAALTIGDVRRHSANAAMIQKSLQRVDLNAKPLPYVPSQRPYVNPYVVPQQR